MSERPAGGPPRAVVFTDLDGTLLDAVTYDPSAAREALDRLRAAGIPVVPVTSKTLAETRRWVERLGLGDVPLVVEGGGAVRLPGETIEVLGTPYPALRSALADIAREVGHRLVGFGDLTDVEVAQHTGMPPDQAREARMRLADEPFFAEPPLSSEETVRLGRAITARGLRLERGGRFFHLLGNVNKGRAVTYVLAWYESHTGGRPLALGIGDAPNDRALLAVVDRPVAVRRPDGTVARELSELPGVRVTNRPGPQGFDEAVRHWLEEGAEDP